MYFGQIVVGPPGSGKTTYCLRMKEFYENFGRSAIVINLDPANENYNFDIDIRELIKISDIKESLELGPNSSILFSFNFLEKNVSWLKNEIEKKGKGKYLIFDSPGQVEIFTLSTSFKSILKYLADLDTGLGVQLCVVNLIESNNLTDMSKYLFAVLSVLNTMILMEFPQVNVISKIDMLKSMGGTQHFPLSFYKNPSQSERFKEFFEQVNMTPKFKKLNNLICELIEDYSLVSFDVLDISNHKHLNRISLLVDKANGYLYNNSGLQKEEKFQDIRNMIAKGDIEFDEDEDYDEENVEEEGGEDEEYNACKTDK